MGELGEGIKMANIELRHLWMTPVLTYFWINLQKCLKMFQLVITVYNKIDFIFLTSDVKCPRGF